MNRILKIFDLHHQRNPQSTGHTNSSELFRSNPNVVSNWRELVDPTILTMTVGVKLQWQTAGHFHLSAKVLYPLF